MDYKDLVGVIKRCGSSESDICRAVLGLPPLQARGFCRLCRGA